MQNVAYLNNGTARLSKSKCTKLGSSSIACTGSKFSTSLNDNALIVCGDKCILSQAIECIIPFIQCSNMRITSTSTWKKILWSNLSNVTMQWHQVNSYYSSTHYTSTLRSKCDWLVHTTKWGNVKEAEVTWSMQMKDIAQSCTLTANPSKFNIIDGILSRKNSRIKSLHSTCPGTCYFQKLESVKQDDI